MGYLAAMVPITAAAKVVSNLMARRNAPSKDDEFGHVLQQTLGTRTVAQRDSDGDGFLTLDEFPGDAKSFALWDSNADGKISAAEIDIATRLGEQWGKLDSNRDDRLSQHEFGVTRDVFNAADRDNDRWVSRAEYFAAYQGDLHA